MPNRRITDLTESTLSTSSYYMAVYDPNEVADIQPDGYIDYNKNSVFWFKFIDFKILI